MESSGRSCAAKLEVRHITTVRGVYERTGDVGALSLLRLRHRRYNCGQGGLSPREGQGVAYTTLAPGWQTRDVGYAMNLLAGAEHLSDAMRSARTYVEVEGRSSPGR
jgi:hypothetical protein